MADDVPVPTFGRRMVRTRRGIIGADAIPRPPSGLQLWLGAHSIAPAPETARTDPPLSRGVRCIPTTP
jgi:hypothetical protein